MDEVSSRDPDGVRRLWAISLFAVLVAAQVVYVVAGRGLAGRPGVAAGGGGVDLGLVIGNLLTGSLALVLCWLRPRNPVGWLFGAAGLALALCDAGEAYGTRALVVPQDHLPLGALVLSLAAPLWLGAVFVPASLMVVRYPSGALSGRWPRRFERTVIIGLAAVYVAYAGSPQSVTDEVPRSRPPVLLPEPLANALMGGGLVLLLLGTALIVGDAVRRVVRSDPSERGALLLLLVTTTASAVLIMTGPSGGPVGTFAGASVLVAITVGVLRYQALGIDLVVRRTLIYATLTGLVLAVFVGVTAALAALLPTGPTPHVVAAVLIAVGLAPARDRIQGLVDRLVYGERDNPAATLKKLGSSMDQVPADGLLLAVTANLAESLHVDGAAIVQPSDEVLATWGEPTGQGMSLPLTFAGADLGRLELGRRRGEAGLSRADRQLLEAVVPLIAAVVHAARLTEQLRDERNRVVDATQAERRRLRQELHDGLGPSLTGIGLGLEAAQAQGRPDAELLTRLRNEVAGSLEEIRRIIDDLRPVSLDGADLVTALRRRTSAAADSGLEVRLSVAADLAALPPDVETALFRIADEALANVVRHARARSCRVTLEVAETARLTVEDDGIGFAGPRPGGVGVGSMRERAERLGGHLAIEASASGTRLTAELPLPDRVVAAP